MEKKKKTPLSAEFWVLFIVICLILSFLLIICYQIYNNRETVIVDEKHEGADIVIDYTSDIKLLSLTDLTPISNAEGINGSEDKFFEFTVDIKQKDAEEVEYELSVIKDKSSTIDDKDVRIYLEKYVNNSYVEVFRPSPFEELTEDTTAGSKKGSMVIYNDSVISSDSQKYRLRLWLSNTSVVTSGSYSIDLAVNAVAK